MLTIVTSDCGVDGAWKCQDDKIPGDKKITLLDKISPLIHVLVLRYAWRQSYMLELGLQFGGLHM